MTFDHNVTILRYDTLSVVIGFAASILLVSHSLHLVLTIAVKNQNLPRLWRFKRLPSLTAVFLMLFLPVLVAVGEINSKLQ